MSDTSNGKNSGTTKIVKTLKRTVSPEAKARSPLAICVYLATRAAPEEILRTTKPITRSLSKFVIYAKNKTISGEIIKHANKERKTSEKFFIGLIICLIVKLRPILNILAKTKIKREIFSKGVKMLIIVLVFF